jgi:proteasome lid subunit RPN8/RPN11
MLRIGFSDYEALRRHGEQTYPHECCGVLLGRAEGAVNVVERVVRAGNTRTDSAHNRYNISAAELIRIQREGREQAFDIIGFYHSHPDHPAYWSATDHAEAHWLGCSYLITRIAHGSAEDTNSFLLTGSSEDDKAFLDEPIEILVAEPVA